MQDSRLLQALIASTQNRITEHGKNIACEAFVEKAILLTFDMFDGPDITEDDVEEYAAVRNILHESFGRNPLDFADKLGDLVRSSNVDDDRFPESCEYYADSLSKANLDADSFDDTITANTVLLNILNDPPPLLLSVMPKSEDVVATERYSPLVSMTLRAAETVCGENRRINATVVSFIAAVIKLFVMEDRPLRDCNEEKSGATLQLQRLFQEDMSKEGDNSRYERLFNQCINYINYNAANNFESKNLSFFLNFSCFDERNNKPKEIFLDETLKKLIDDPYELKPFLDERGKQPSEHHQPDIEGYRSKLDIAYSPEFISILEDIDRDAYKNVQTRTCEEFVRVVLEKAFCSDKDNSSEIAETIDTFNKYFGKIPVLALKKIEKYQNSAQYEDITANTLDNAHRRMLLDAAKNNQKAVFVGDLINEVLSNPTKFLRDLHDGGTEWGHSDVSYSWIMNRLWLAMSNLPNCPAGDPTCERFLAVVLIEIGCSSTERSERKLRFEAKRMKEVLVMALGITGETEESQHQQLYRLYEVVIRRIRHRTSGTRYEAHLFISLLERFEDDDFTNVVFSYDLLEFLLKDKGSPLHEYCVVKQLGEENDNPTKLDEMVATAKNIRRALSKKIYGQENAINVFITAYFRSLITPAENVKPKATLLFAGPPGTGKTFMAETAAQALGLPFLRVDMSEYSDKEANLEFCGSDQVYRNSHEGFVTSFVNRNPKCILLFDEIEKAHANVIHLFLQMLDAGRLRDNNTDEEVSFRDAIIIMTTNAGRQLYENSERENLSGTPQSVIIDALAKDIDHRTGAPYFPAAICSRLAAGSVVMFNHIEAASLEQITREAFERKKQELSETYGIETDIDENVCTALLLSQGTNTDARTIKACARTFFENELYELLSLAADSIAVNNLKKISIKTDIPDNETISSLFNSSKKPSVLVFSSKKAAKQCRDNCKTIRIYSAQTIEKAVETVKSEEIKAVLIDLSFGREGNALEYLNAEDVESLSRDFMRYVLSELKYLPVYLLLPKGKSIREEEMVSFYRIGVKGTIELSQDFGNELATISRRHYRQESMKRLATANNVLTFETAQSVSEDGSSACIRLFDFKLKTAIRAEDTKDILMTRPSERFDDIIGAQEAKKELSYFVEYLKNPKKYIGFGTKTPKGVLLYGPPGTGKTMLARAVACESGLTFIASEGNSFLKKYVGEGAKAVHRLFGMARKYAPAILFIDEIDAVAMSRTGDNADSATLTALLTELDGFKNDRSRPVFVLAATNVDIMHGAGRGIDPALLRRFDRKVLVGLPAREDRRTFIAKRAAKNPAFAVSDSEIDSIAMRSVGMSLAELDSVLELCLRCAIRAGSQKVTDEIFEDAFETFHSGEMKKWDESQLRRVAVHESGHAFICHICGETPSYLTIVARDSHGGYMQHSDNETKAIYTKDELLGRIRTSLGGRAAEIVFYGENEGISTGASGDIESATRLAERMVSSYGMDKDFGLGYVRPGAGDIDVELHRAVNRILEQEMQKAVEMIDRNRQTVERLADRLLERNYLIGEEIEEVLNGGDESAVKD